MIRPNLRLASLAISAVIVAAACTGAAATPTAQPTATPAPTTAAATPAPALTNPPTTAPTPAPTANPCDKAALKTLAAGKLTIGTDNPAYPPYYAAPSDGKYHAPWKADTGDPYTGEGFESAVAYAVAAKLGFAQADVTWTSVPFDNSFKPGAKTFDLYMAQVSYTTERAQAVDLSDGYYFVNQAVVALKSNDVTKAKTVADLQKFKFGAQTSTTAYSTITDTIKPTAKAMVYNTNDAAIAALKAKQIDAIVVDGPTADFITNVQLDGSVIVGQFAAAQGPNAEHFSMVLAKGSPLTTCVNQAIASLKADGTLDTITKKWLAFETVPVFGQ